jgi:hypothetical protein
MSRARYARRPTLLDRSRLALLIDWRAQGTRTPITAVEGRSSAESLRVYVYIESLGAYCAYDGGFTRARIGTISPPARRPSR